MHIKLLAVFYLHISEFVLLMIRPHCHFDACRFVHNAVHKDNEMTPTGQGSFAKYKEQNILINRHHKHQECGCASLSCSSLYHHIGLSAS